MGEIKVVSNVNPPLTLYSGVTVQHENKLYKRVIGLNLSHRYQAGRHIIAQAHH